MDTSLWAVRLEGTLESRDFLRLLPLLPETRQERLLRLRPEARREPLCAWLLLRLALREQYGWKSLPAVEVTPMGKPWFPEAPQVHFNLSHTEGAVMAGIACQPIGVDIERIRPVSPRLMKRLGADTEEACISLWVHQEAQAKCLGIGIRSQLRRESAAGSDKSYREVKSFPGYVSGAAIRGGDVPECLLIRNMEDLLRDSAV